MAAKPTQKDETYMRLALAEARRALGRTRPNPAVGAVVVRNGRVVALGHHRKAGQPHAEAEALAVAGTAARGATLYVTLEPCCHTGRTGPCTAAIEAAGIKRVVIGCRDANPVVDGRGTSRLRRAGVEVVTGCLEDECRELNRPFFCWISKGRPLVTLKFASTLDGVIGDAPRPDDEVGVRWITGKRARAHVHQLRALHHAVLVGRGTIEADDPQLTVRAPRLPPGGSREILRVVLDSELRTSPTCRLVSEKKPGPAPLFVAAAPRAEAKASFDARRTLLEETGAEVLLVERASEADGLPLGSVLQALAKRQVQSLLVEGGSRVLGSFVSAALVDDVEAFIAPRLAGGGVPVAAGLGRGLTQALPLEHVRTKSLGEDLLISARVRA